MPRICSTKRNADGKTLALTWINGSDNGAASAIVTSTRSRTSGIISAGGVGFDISCGIRCLRTGVQWSEVVSRAQVLSDSLFRGIPAGVGEEGKVKLAPDELHDVLTGGGSRAVRKERRWRRCGARVHRGARLHCSRSKT
jgi:RNA-splicing ligase RtcB